MLRMSSVPQVHEWGGVVTDILTYSPFRQFRPGLRTAINSHGGHYWSTQVPYCCDARHACSSMHC